MDVIIKLTPPPPPPPPHQLICKYAIVTFNLKSNYNYLSLTDTTSYMHDARPTGRRSRTYVAD